jgi:hypothetical protein
MMPQVVKTAWVSVSNHLREIVTSKLLSMLRRAIVDGVEVEAFEGLMTVLKVFGLPSGSGTC